MNQEAHQARAYSGFCRMKQLEVFLLPLDEILLHHRIFPHEICQYHFSRFIWSCHWIFWLNLTHSVTIRHKCYYANKKDSLSVCLPQVQNVIWYKIFSTWSVVHYFGTEHLIDQVFSCCHLGLKLAAFYQHEKLACLTNIHSFFLFLK